MALTKGLTLITPSSVVGTGGTPTISASGTVSLGATSSAVEFRGCFSSTYRDYLVLVHTSAGLNGITLTMVSGSTVNTSTVMYAQRVIFNNTTISTTTDAAAAGALIFNNSNIAHGVRIYISNPQQVAETSGWAWGLYGTSTIGQQSYFRHSATTQFDGFKLTFSSAATSGDEVSIYGYNV